MHMMFGFFNIDTRITKQKEPAMIAHDVLAVAFGKGINLGATAAWHGGYSSVSMVRWPTRLIR